MIIDMNYESLRFGGYLGFKLSRLEWIWGSSFEFAQEEFETSKAEILYNLPLECTQIDETDYKSFIASILAYYLRTDICVYSAILIGISIQRSLLVGASKDSRKNQELRELAESALVSIPKKIVSDRKELFEKIMERSGKDLFEIFDFLEQFCGEGKKEEDVSKLENNKEQIPTLFLSYCQKDTPIANIIESQLKYETNNGIRISRYTRVPYKESFKEFMNSIPEHDFVLCIVSDSYLKSQACMYEVGEIIKDHNFERKLLFVVLVEGDEKYYSSKENGFGAAKIYGSEKNRLEYVKYWKQQYQELDQAIEEIGNTEAVIRSSEELREIGRIYRHDISEFLTYLSQNKGKNFEELFINNFADILKWIFPKWESRMFAKCTNFTELLTSAINEIWKITATDYNQIALNVKIKSHETGLVVYADNVSERKQRYRLVIMEGLMGNSFSTGKLLNVGDIEKKKGYFNAVNETKSELIVPIKFQGNVIGVINSEAEKRNHYTEAMEESVGNIADKLSIALNRLGYVSNISMHEIPYIHIEYPQSGINDNM